MATASRRPAALLAARLRHPPADSNRRATRIVRAVHETGGVVSTEDVRAFASTLPRAYEALVRDRVKFRVGRIVFLAFSRDETIMGFGFPKEERAALVAAEPDKFLMPGQSDLRYHWVQVRLAAIDRAEMQELVLDAWRMCVPRKVASGYLAPLDSNRPASAAP
jgi:hypothetical protein